MGSDGSVTICRCAATIAGLLNIVQPDQVLPDHLQRHVKITLAGNAAAQGPDSAWQAQLAGAGRVLPEAGTAPRSQSDFPISVRLEVP